MIAGFDMRNNLSLSYDTQGQYATDLFTNVAIDTIEKHNKRVPLFMYVAHTAPHAANEYNPLQAPIDEIAKHAHIEDKKRRTYAAMVTKLDDSVGKIVTALKKRNMLENSVIIFAADNGAPIKGQFANSGSNFPLRGVYIIFFNNQNK